VPPVDVGPDELEAHALSPDCVLWVDCDAPTTDDVRHLASALHIHDLTAEDIAKGGQRTKLERYADHYHVALHDCRLVDSTLAQVEVDVVFADGWVLTIRHAGEGGGSPSLDDARQRFERQRGEHGSNDEGFLLWAIMDVIVDRYFGVTEAVDERLDDIEDLVFDDTMDEIPRDLFTLRRSIVAFRRVVGPLREVINELLRREVTCLSDAALVHIQDVYDHVLRILDLVETQRELLTGLLEAQLAVMSNRMNQVMKATSSWGAILIVATLIAGIYGMNFQHMPELGWEFGYAFALGTMLVAMLILYFVFKRRGWL
jgi:magnesium transporter